MKSHFITGTGTGVGKTFVTAALAAQLREKGKRVIALKPVISGFDPAQLAASDTGILLKAQGLPLSQAGAGSISPWRFPDPVSPDMAAENAGKTISFSDLIAFCRKNETADYLLVEGAGGKMTPIGDDYTVLDWMAALDYEVILVSGSYLGTLSHTLAACEAMSARKLRLRAVIVSESETQPVPLERTLLTLRRFLPNNLLTYALPRMNDADNLSSILL
jgi:dethiobiotin synthetase